MSSNGLLQKIIKLSVQCFSRDLQKSQNLVTPANLEQIQSLANKITAADLNIDTNLFHDTGSFDPQRDSAPVTYMHIYENEDVTVCVFILKSGARVPLHDHPGMNGFLKVIHGTVSIQSYTVQEKLNFGNEQPLVRGKRRISDIYSAVKHSCQNVVASDSVCYLSPSAHNLHEIRSVGGTAAFLDILSPPYGSDKRTGFERDCHYFKEIERPKTLPSSDYLPSDSVLLVNIPTPLDFWCERAEYEGPSLSNLEAV